MDERNDKRSLFRCFSKPKKSKKGCERLLPTTILGKQCKNVWATVMENNSHLISIHGRIGVGKTTVLHYINNRFLQRSSYDFIIFLRFLTPSALQGEIATRIGLSATPGWNQKGFDQKCAAIFDCLSRKRYALLIDDFWGTTSVFGEIGLPCPNSINKCKVVVAYCDHTFADTHIQILPLAWEDAWCLFKQEIRDELDPQISSLAAQLALLCQGLPQALIQVACIMKFNTTLEEWQNAIQILENYVPERGYEDLARILCDELGRNSMFQARVKAQTKKPASNCYVHDRLCKIGRGLGELKHSLAELSRPRSQNHRIINQALEIVNGLSSYICES
ncbi:probable disease resistance protein At1g52660 [Euphorbia lathyris]|uniref:probable disease resistance protein At1g52660 n=1 Tax=Euphorbia lathyris TaxID=212925 RepID=UPI0033139FFA